MDLFAWLKSNLKIQNFNVCTFVTFSSHCNYLKMIFNRGFSIQELQAIAIKTASHHPSVEVNELLCGGKLED